MSSSDQPLPAKQYEVKIDPSIAASHMPGARQAEFDRALEAVLQRTPASVRDDVRKRLTDARAIPMSSSDPEVARLLGVIASIRAADNQMATNLQMEEVEKLAKPRGELLRLVVALAAELSNPDARAVVVRRPGDKGVPVILLRESDATPEDLERGIRAAFDAKGQYGASVDERVDIVVGTSRSEPAVSPQVWELYLNAVRGFEPSNLPGIGTVRSISTASYRPPRLATKGAR